MKVKDQVYDHVAGTLVHIRTAAEGRSDAIRASMGGGADWKSVLLHPLSSDELQDAWNSQDSHGSPLS